MNQAIHGLLLVDKPCGITSHDVVARVRRILGTKSVGHSGTLDPLASGLMVLLIGEATKLSQYILEGNKSYRVGFRLGIKTDTFDITGKVLEEKPVAVTSEQVLAQALSLAGEKQWQVPSFSAVKVGGEKLYDLARQQIEFTPPTKIMKFWDIKPVSEGGQGGPCEFSFDISCSKGSYIRSWVDELGKALGCGATMISLVRTWSEPYFLSQAASLEQLEQQKKSGNQLDGIIPIHRALPLVKRVVVKGLDHKLLSNGQIGHDLRIQLIQSFRPEQDQVIQVMSEASGKPMALIGLDPAKGFVIRRVFNFVNT